MADILAPAERSAVMAQIRSTGNSKTELKLIALFRDRKIAGWRRGQRLLLNRAIVRPDFIFWRGRVVVFVDGEFWHGHPTRAKIPATRHEWWKAKIEGNKKRDRLQNRVLRKNGWTVVRIWQHELTKKHLSKALTRLLQFENSRC